MAVNGTPRGSATESFHAAITVLGAWVAERGTADVPSRVTYAGFALGRWTARCRAGYHAGTLTATEVATLQAVVGWDWGITHAQWWQRGFDGLREQAGAESRRVARELRDAGLSVADTAAVMDLSRGRVSQLISS